jgi:hypothetical protein
VAHVKRSEDRGTDVFFVRHPGYRLNDEAQRVVVLIGVFVALARRLLEVRSGQLSNALFESHAALVVTERSNAATKERLKSGHAVGGLSIL